MENFPAWGHSVKGQAKLTCSLSCKPGPPPGCQSPCLQKQLASPWITMLKSPHLLCERNGIPAAGAICSAGHSPGARDRSQGPRPTTEESGYLLGMADQPDMPGTGWDGIRKFKNIPKRRNGSPRLTSLVWAQGSTLRKLLHCYPRHPTKR